MRVGSVQQATIELRLSPCFRDNISTTQHNERQTTHTPLKVKEREDPGVAVLVRVPLLALLS